ncbi:unnamed protein product [Ostreobium quekettii]|uniref:Protein kinase domain-containing protein n=1 Tax=Ostreobium quekettii TaxID=121088 RepID=A0A8S1JCR4_9CHLO|nr:unnamed protein product [Ostreobium quekettii]
MVIAEIRRPGITSRLYSTSIRRQKHHGWKRKHPRGIDAGLDPQAPANRREGKPLPPNLQSAGRPKLPGQPILNIENAAALVGGWQSLGKHWAVREGVWFDKDGRAWKVAIKSPTDTKDRACAEAINNECSTLTAVPHHPNIVWVIGGRMGDDPVIVEELMPVNLGRLLSKSGSDLTYRDILMIGVGVARGMCHLHEHGHTRTYMTPSSILLDEEGNAMLARFSDTSDVSNFRDASDGTPAYMAPECLPQNGAAVRGPRAAQLEAEKAGVYSLGKVLSKCVAASLGVSEAAAGRLCHAPLWEFICCCIRPHPQDRPGCHQVVEELNGMLDGSGSSTEDWSARRLRAQIWRASR